MGRFINPVTQPNDDKGRSEPNSRLYFFEPGTTTPKTAFFDKDLTAPNTHPVEADGAGRFPDMWLQAGGYRVEFRDKNDVLIWERDNVDDASSEFIFSLNSVLSAVSISDLLSKPTVADGTTANVFSFYEDKGEGGGVFIYDENRSKLDHDGGMVISSTVPFDGNPSNISDFIDGVGDTDPGGTGCWVREFDGETNVYIYGAVGDESQSDSKSIQSAIDFAYSTQENTGVDYSITKVIPNPAYASSFPNVTFNNGTFKISTTVAVPENMKLTSKNGSILVDTAVGFTISEQTTIIDGFYFFATAGTPSNQAIDINLDASANSQDVPIITIRACFFKNIANCFAHNANVINGFSILKVENSHFINCLQVSSRVRSDRAEFNGCSIYGMFNNDDISVISCWGSGVSANNCTFVPWAFVDSGTEITNARWFDLNDGLLTITDCRFGNEDINSGNNPVSPYFDALNVTTVYNYSELKPNLGTGDNQYENANMSGIFISNTLLNHRNSGAVKLFKLPNFIDIRTNKGASGATFDSNLDVTKKDYMIVLDPSFTYPSKSVMRTAFQLRIEPHSDFIQLIDTGSSYASEIWESLVYENYNKRFFIPDSISGATATFTLDVSKLPAAHSAKIRIYGKPRNGEDNVAIADIDYKSRVFYDTTALTTSKQLLTVDTDFTRADEGGSIVYDTPGIAQLQWGAGGATTTDLDRKDLRIAITNIGDSTDLLSCYAVLIGDSSQWGIHV